VTESMLEWSRHKDARLGAALAFYTMFSLTPLLLVAVSIVGLVTSKASAEHGLTEMVQRLVGPEGAGAVQMLLAGAHSQKSGIVLTIVGLGVLLFGASSVMLDLRDSLNTIWEVRPPETTGFQSVMVVVKDRLFSLLLVVAAGFLVLVSLMVSTFLAAAGAIVTQVLPVTASVLHWVDGGASFLLTTLLFAAIYRALPSNDLDWTDVMLGSVITSVLFTVGKVLLAFYLGKASFRSTYGAAASLVVLIVWVYYSSQIFFFGAELTRSYARRRRRVPRSAP